MCFVDLEKPYEEYEVDGPLLHAIQSLYCWSQSLVCIATSKSGLFPVTVGLHQGCPLSQVLFIIFRGWGLDEEGIVNIIEFKHYSTSPKLD